MLAIEECKGCCLAVDVSKRELLRLNLTDTNLFSIKFVESNFQR